jgi:hypothetical protein
VETVHYNRVSRASSPAYALLCDRVDGRKFCGAVGIPPQAVWTEGIASTRSCLPTSIATSSQPCWCILYPRTTSRTTAGSNRCRSRLLWLTQRMFPIETLPLTPVLPTPKHEHKTANLALTDTRTDSECGNRSKDTLHVSVSFTTITAAVPAPASSKDVLVEWSQTHEVCVRAVNPAMCPTHAKLQRRIYGSSFD